MSDPEFVREQFEILIEERNALRGLAVCLSECGEELARCLNVSIAPDEAIHRRGTDAMVRFWTLRVESVAAAGEVTE